MATEEHEKEIARMRKIEKQDRYRGSLNIRTPQVECAKKRAKWYGMPPTPLATPNVWRPAEPKF